MTDEATQSEARRTTGARPQASLADRVAEARPAVFRESFPPASRVKFLVIAALVVVLNAWQFPPLVRAWMDDPNWSHGFMIPLFSLYLIYARWGQLMSAKRRVCLWGAPLAILAIVLTMIGVHPLGVRLVSRVGMILLAFAMVLYLAGPGVLRVVWLPVLFLLFAVPIPEMLYAGVAEPLQELAAKGSTVILRLFGVRISSGASSISLISLSDVPHHLTVAEACSGMRLLMAFVALGVVMAYLENRPRWQRVILVAAAVPIAVLCNVLRVTITSTMYVLDRPELGQDFMHSFTGIVMLIPALALLWGLGRLLQALFVEVDAEADPPPGRAASPPRGATG